MADKQKTEKSVDKTKQFKKWAEKNVLPVVDFVLKALAVGYLIGTSLLYARDWLANVEVNSDFALAGAIMVTSIATYLIVRKR